MLVRSGSRTLLVMPLNTTAEATQSPTLEPSVYMPVMRNQLIRK